MLIRCDMAEDEELLALASDVYRMGKYDEVILKYLMEYRYGLPCFNCILYICHHPGKTTSPSLLHIIQFNNIVLFTILYIV